MEETNKNAVAGQAPNAEIGQPTFSIEKIYVKDLSLEVPLAPQVYVETDSPEVSIQLTTQASEVNQNLFEANLKITVTAAIQDKVYFVVELTQSGLFVIANIPAEQVDPLLGIACPNLLFPYAREAVSDAVMRAGFPPAVLQPVNFEALYVARLEEEAKKTNSVSSENQVIQQA